MAEEKKSKKKERCMWKGKPKKTNRTFCRCFSFSFRHLWFVFCCWWILFFFVEKLRKKRKPRRGQSFFYCFYLIFSSSPCLYSLSRSATFFFLCKNKFWFVFFIISSSIAVCASVRVRVDANERTIERRQPETGHWKTRKKRVSFGPNFLFFLEIISTHLSINPHTTTTTQKQISLYSSGCWCFPCFVTCLLISIRFFGKY